MKSLIKDAVRKKPNLQVHPRALQIFEAYLAAYSFQVNVSDRAAAMLRKADQRGHFKWPECELRDLHGQAELPPIGVPQGGALSCLIANAVLHEADKAMRRLGRRIKKSFRYLRYCDDMILLAYDKDVCTQAYSLYQDVLRRLKLPAHPPKEINSYSKQFWEGKSNAPYRWRCPSQQTDVPWIQFVGYQIRYDGVVRIRLKSLKKQMTKLTQLADQLLAALNPGRRAPGQVRPFATGIRATGRQIAHRFHQRLISQAVGRRKLWHHLDEPLPLCWANGFRGLLDKKLVLSHFKALDQHRERQLRRITRRLLVLPAQTTHIHSENSDALRFYGYPFSYCGQFQLRSKRWNTGR